MAAPTLEKMKSVKQEEEEEKNPKIMVTSVGKTLCKEHWEKVIELIQKSKGECSAYKACKGVEKLIPVSNVKTKIKVEDGAGSSTTVVIPKEEPAESLNVPIAEKPVIPPVLDEEEGNQGPDAALFDDDVQLSDGAEDEEAEADDEMNGSSDSSSTTSASGGDEMDLDEGPDSEKEYRTPSKDDWEEEEGGYEPTDSNAEED